MENKNKKNLKNNVYSIRITKEQKQILKKNDWIKKDLDKLVRDFLKIYSEWTIRSPSYDIILVYKLINIPICVRWLHEY